MSGLKYPGKISNRFQEIKKRIHSKKQSGKK
jgi:hypothetical protein